MNNKNMCFTKHYTNQFINSLCGLFIVGLLLFPLLGVAAEGIASWQDISNKVSSTKSNAIRSRRNPDATVIVQITNNSGADLAGPFRLVITGLDPNTGAVEVSNETGTTAAGEPYFDLAPYVSETFIAGTTSDRISVKVAGGGRNLFAFNVRVEQEIIDTPEPVELSVKITSPATLGTVGASPLAIQGTISDPEATLTLNGVSVEHTNGRFAANVALSEGHNTVLARVVAADGTETTNSISIALDTTPPFITIESPLDASTVNDASIAVSGLVNDIVRGTVSQSQAIVRVNGQVATVSNRSYLAQAIVLTEGENTITVTGSDEQGNTASTSITINYQIPAAKKITLVSGQNQIAQIRSVLAEPLKVKLVDAQGNPVANTNVIYRVIQGDGSAGSGTADEGRGILAKTDASGIASTQFKLGSRSGQGNHRVRAKAVGFDSEVVFYASAETNPGNKVSINSGNNQRGAPNQSLPQPLIVAVTDEGANLVQGAQVEFKVTVGSGKFQNNTANIVSITDSDGRASASLILGEETGLDVHRVTATLVGTSLNAGFTASALQQGDPGQTRITGLVLDNQDNPLPNVSVRVEGTNRQAVTNAQGQFTITEAPVGPVHILVDGSTTTVAGEWPTLSYNIVTIAGAENPLATPVYMVKLDTEHAVFVGREDKVLTLDELPGFKLEVKAGSVTFPDGSREGLLSVTPVNASKVPMAPPNGMQPQLIVTIQPSGAIFNPPAPLTLPNVDGHPPGAQVEMYSYDHDLEEFVTIGLGTVSGDGSLIQSNIGVGVIKAGWHCGSQPGGQGCANDCVICKDCDGDCNCVAADGDPRLAPLEVTGDCKKAECNGGAVIIVNDDDDQPSELCEACENGSVVEVTVEVSNVPNTICVGQSKPMNVKLVPNSIQERYGRPRGSVLYDSKNPENTGEVSLSFGSGGAVTITGTRPYAGNTKIGFWPFDILAAPGGDTSCNIKEANLLVLPRNVENIPGKINRITAYNFMTGNCPDFPTNDNRRAHEIDGCSGGIAQDPTNFGGLYVGYITGSQQYNQHSTAFGESQLSPSPVINLPCNNHDICYQDCSASYQQANCDDNLLGEAIAVCRTAYPITCPASVVTAGECGAYAEERQLCLTLADRTHTGLQVAGFAAYYDRQNQYCLCCDETK